MQEDITIPEETITIDLGAAKDGGEGIVAVDWYANKALPCEVTVTLAWTVNADETIDTVHLSAGLQNGTIVGDFDVNNAGLNARYPDASFIVAPTEPVEVDGVKYTFVLH